MIKPTLEHLENSGEFIGRHIGPSDADISDMLKIIGAADLHCSGMCELVAEIAAQKAGDPEAYA